jgi:hypothetical protein
MLEQMPGKLECEVLEGQSWAVEQFQREYGTIQLHQRHDGGVVEPGIGAAAHSLQIREFDRVPRKGSDDARRQFRIGQAAQRPQLRGGKHRPALRHIQPAIRCQPGQQHAREIFLLGLAPCRYVTHAIPPVKAVPAAV